LIDIKIKIKCYTNAKRSSGERAQRIGDLINWAVRWANRDFGRQGTTGPGAAATAAGHPTRPGACGASDIAVGPTRTEARDSTGSVARGAASEWACHGLLVHNRFHKNRSGENA